MPEITEHRINELKMSIHSMRLRLGMWLSNLRLAKKEKGLIRHNKNILLNSNNNFKYLYLNLHAYKTTKQQENAKVAPLQE